MTKIILRVYVCEVLVYVVQNAPRAIYMNSR